MPLPSCSRRSRSASSAAVTLRAGPLADQLLEIVHRQRAIAREQQALEHALEAARRRDRQLRLGDRRRRPPRSTPPPAPPSRPRRLRASGRPSRRAAPHFAAARWAPRSPPCPRPRRNRPRRGVARRVRGPGDVRIRRLFVQVGGSAGGVILSCPYVSSCFSSFSHAAFFVRPPSAASARVAGCDTFGLARDRRDGHVRRRLHRRLADLRDEQCVVGG